MENINLKIENFEGPFDLLLRLVKINKMEISDISISDITNQYLTVLNQMEEMDLEIASEFFLMAASLIEIKSRELLPKKKDEPELIPTKELLLHRLKEYEFFKNTAYEFLERYDTEQVIVTKLPDTIEEDEVSMSDFIKGVSTTKLFEIYMSLLDRQREKTNTVTVIDKKIPVDSYKIEDKMDQLKVILNNQKEVRFSEIGRMSENKAEIIVFFLAVLELCRHNAVRIVEYPDASDFILERRGDINGK